MFCIIRPSAVEAFRISAHPVSLPLGPAYVAAAVESSGRSVCVVDAVGEAPTKKTRYFKKIKSKYEVISIFSNKDLLKVKKILIKNVN